MVTSFPQGEIELIQPLQTADIKGKFGIDIEAAQPFLCMWGLAAALRLPSVGVSSGAF